MLILYSENEYIKEETVSKVEMRSRKIRIKKKLERQLRRAPTDRQRWRGWPETGKGWQRRLLVFRERGHSSRALWRGKGRRRGREGTGFAPQREFPARTQAGRRGNANAWGVHLGKEESHPEGRHPLPPLFPFSPFCLGL